MAHTRSVARHLQSELNGFESDLFGDTSVVCGVGIDLVDVPRFRAKIERTPRLVQAVFTPAEREYAARSTDPTLRLAARFAVKEAVVKALQIGIGTFPVRDIEIYSGLRREPLLRLNGAGAEHAAAVGIRGWEISMSHLDQVAVGLAVAIGPRHELKRP